MGSLGRLEPRKGHQTLIRALPRVLASIPDATLLIAGHDPHGYSENLRNLARELGVESNVKFPGFQADIWSFFDQIDLFTFASYSEGFGKVLVEAMAAGRPVVASTLSPIDEIVIPESTGLLCPVGDANAFADAIIEMHGDPERASRFGAAGQRRVRQEFTLDKMLSGTIDLYERVVRQSARFS